MRKPKVTAVEHIDFLIGSARQGTATEAERTQPGTADSAAHDAYTRRLHRLEPDAEALWADVAGDVRPTSGVLVLADSVFRIVANDGTAAHWATGDLGMDNLTRLKWAEASWRIEEYHRGLEQVTNVERCQCRAGRSGGTPGWCSARSCWPSGGATGRASTGCGPTG